MLIKLLLLLLVANGAPILIRKLMGGRWSAPIDGRLLYRDGRRLFGPTKTWRGLFASILATVAMAAVLGLPAWLGLLIATAAMAGDLLSSFIKRRLGMRPSHRATGLDQVPESLLPVLLVMPVLQLAVLDVLLLVAAFFILETVLSRWLFRLHIRRQPH